MNYAGAFAPGSEETITLSVTTTNIGDILPGSGDVLRVVNAGSTLCFVRIGTPEVAATVTNIPMLAGSVQYFSIPSTASSDDYYITAITASGSTTLYYTRGSLG